MKNKTTHSNNENTKDEFDQFFKNVQDYELRVSTYLSHIQEETGFKIKPLPFHTTQLHHGSSLHLGKLTATRNRQSLIFHSKNQVFIPWQSNLSSSENQNLDIPLAKHGDAVTVVIPNFNKGELIKRCIQSLLDQTYANLEILIIDDASDDESITLARQFAGEDNRVRLLVNEVNRGVSFTRDRGIRSATAQLVTTLDSDDFYPDNKKIEREVRLLCNYAKKGQAVVAFSKMAFYHADGQKLHNDKRSIVEGNIFKHVFARDKFIPHHFLFYKQMYEIVGGLDENIEIYEDWDLKIRLARIFSFYCTGHEGYAYVDPGKGLSGADKLTHRKWLEKVFNKNSSLLKDREYPYAFRNFCEKALKEHSPKIRRRPRVYLHIGASKTGTSAIQSMSERNRDILENSGFYWLNRVTASGIASTIAHDMEFTGHITKPWLPTLNITEEIQRIWNACVQNNLGAAIVSSEYFWDSFGFYYEDFLQTESYTNFLCQLISYFNDFDIKIIVYLRRQDKHLESIIREYIKSIGPLDKDLIYRSFQPSYAYRDRIHLLESLVGHGNVIVKSFERDQILDVITDFYKTVGVEGYPESFQPLDNYEDNPRLHRDVLEYINDRRIHDGGAWNNVDFQKKYVRKIKTSSHLLLDVEDYPFLSTQEAYEIFLEYQQQNVLEKGHLFQEEPLPPKGPLVQYPGLSKETKQRLDSIVNDKDDVE